MLLKDSSGAKHSVNYKQKNIQGALKKGIHLPKMSKG